MQRCVVPNCENYLSEGVHVPEDEPTRKVWLNNLQITEEEIGTERPLVCFDHFDKDDFEESVNEDGAVVKTIRIGATPKAHIPFEAIEKETEEFLEFKNQKLVEEEKSDAPEGVVQEEAEKTQTSEPEAFLAVEQGYQTAQFYEGDQEIFGEEEETSVSSQIFVPEAQPVLTEEGRKIFITEDEEERSVAESTTTEPGDETSLTGTAENAPSEQDDSTMVGFMDESQAVATQQPESEAPKVPVAENVLMQWFVPNDNKPKVTETPDAAAEGGNDAELQSETTQALTEDETAVAESMSLMGNDKSTEACRLCGTSDQVDMNILHNVVDNVMVLEAMQELLHPLEVSLEDQFSKSICTKCFENLRNFHLFRESCLKFDEEQRREYEKSHPSSKTAHAQTSADVSPTAYEEREVVTMSGPRNLSRKVILTPTGVVQQRASTSAAPKSGSAPLARQIFARLGNSEDVQVYKPKRHVINYENGKNYYGTKTKSAAPTIGSAKLKQSQIDALARNPPLSMGKQLKIQEELKKVIEGKMSKDDLSVDHVIVRVVSDDDDDDYDDQVVYHRKRKKIYPEYAKLHRGNTGQFKKMRVGRNEVVLPKGIRVTVQDRFESSKGIFPCFPKFGPFNIEFGLINGYLFEHRLCKQKERYLRCVSVSCPAFAVQKLAETGEFEKRATVQTAHNHHQLTNIEIRKQMFYYVMKKRMQADKGLSFSKVYEQICEKDPEMKSIVPLKTILSEICKYQLTLKIPFIKTFDDFFYSIEDDGMQKFQFTYLGKQFYQERFAVREDDPDGGAKAVVFATLDTMEKVSDSKLMYVDASFRIETGEDFFYQLVTVLVWIDDSYYPIMFALVSSRTMDIFKKIFVYLRDILAPKLRPDEIVTDYEANLYYALGETYVDSHIGGSVFYYTQNLYKKICELGLSTELETTAYFRNIYHMLLMLPLLPVNTIADGLHNIEIQANDLAVGDICDGLFEHVKEQWMQKVTPELFCVHQLENRINENVIAPFKKLRDFLLISKGKNQRQSMSIVNVVEKLIDLEHFLQTTYKSENKKTFSRDLSSSQKKNVLKAWQYIEAHPKININHFFTRVIGYIKCMENQLWIWGYYKFNGQVTDELINSSNFSIIVNNNDQETAEQPENADDSTTVVVEAVVGPTGEFVLNSEQVENTVFKYA